MGQSHESSEERAAIEMLERDLSQPESEYIALVWRALSDRILTAEERTEVISAAKSRGLSRDDCFRLHRNFLKHLALATLAQGDITPEQEADLQRIARLLGLNKEDPQLAIQNAQQDAEQLAALLINMSGETQGEIPQQSLSARLRTSLNPSRWLAPINVGADAMSSAISLISRRHNIPCRKCRKETQHGLSMGKGFPIRGWLMVAWQARSLSAPGFIFNAATLVASDRRLMAQTGQSLLPQFCCSTCGTSSDHWEAARVLLKVTAVGNSQEPKV